MHAVATADELQQLFVKLYIFPDEIARPRPRCPTIASEGASMIHEVEVPFL